MLAQAISELNFRHGNNCLDLNGAYTVHLQKLVLLDRPTVLEKHKTPKNRLGIWGREEGEPPKLAEFVYTWRNETGQNLHQCKFPEH